MAGASLCVNQAVGKPKVFAGASVCVMVVLGLTDRKRQREEVTQARRLRGRQSETEYL